MMDPGMMAEGAMMDEHQLAALREEQKKADAERLNRLDSLAGALVAKRRDAIVYRSTCGIETIWSEDEDAFDGIDDANRAFEGAIARHRYTKPAVASGRVERDTDQADPNKCILLPNITGPYCEAGSASIADILLPMDDWPFGIGTTPIPELTAVLEQIKKFDDEQPVSMPGMTQPEPAGKVRDRAEQEMEKAKKSAEKAETRIKDWLTECQWHGKSRRQIDDAGRVGTGITKGPIPVQKKQYVWKEEAGVQQLIINEETKPVTENVDYWNLYPDPACGDNIHNGGYIWERGDITRKTLQDLLGQESNGYIDSQIMLCLVEGPQKAEIDAGTRNIRNVSVDDSLFEIWWFHGALERDELEAAGCNCSDQDEKYLSVPAVITMVNGHPIRASLNHLDKGSFPYDILTWRRRPGMPWGQGIARQIRPAQRGITACFRAVMENAGLSAKPMLAVLRKYLHPTDNTWDLFGGKVFEVDADADVRDIKAAITTIQIESRQVELLNIINFLMKLAEDITGLPVLLQGQQGKAPDTVGGMTILNNNASVTRRRIARQFDDQVIEPSISRYYDYLMQYGKDEEEKGLYVIDARSSSVLVERDIQNKNMIQLLGASADPEYGVDRRKAYAETALAMKIDPKRLQYDDAAWEKRQKDMQNRPPPPQVMIAQMREEGATKRTALELRAEMEAQERSDKFEEILAKYDGELKLALKDKDSENKIRELKVGLASDVMKLRTQVSLSPGKQVAMPPSEPAGLAAPGNAYAQ